MARQGKMDFRTEDEKPFVSDGKLSKIQFMAKYADTLNKEYLEARYKWHHARNGKEAAIIWTNEVVPLFLKHHTPHIEL